MIFYKNYFDKIRWKFLIYECGPLKDEIVCYFDNELCIIGINKYDNVVVLKFNFEQNNNYLYNVNIYKDENFLYSELMLMSI